MATVKMRAPELEILNTDVEFDAADSTSHMIGTLKISRVSIEWRPANVTYSFRLSWEDLGD